MSDSAHVCAHVSVAVYEEFGRLARQFNLTAFERSAVAVAFITHVWKQAGIDEKQELQFLFDEIASGRTGTANSRVPIRPDDTPPESDNH